MIESDGIVSLMQLDEIGKDPVKLNPDASLASRSRHAGRVLQKSIGPIWSYSYSVTWEK